MLTGTVCTSSCLSENQLKLNSVFDVIGLIYLHFGFRCEQVYSSFVRSDKNRFTPFPMLFSRFSATATNEFICLPIKYLYSATESSTNDFMAISRHCLNYEIMVDFRRHARSD